MVRIEQSTEGGGIYSGPLPDDELVKSMEDGGGFVDPFSTTTDEKKASFIKDSVPKQSAWLVFDCETGPLPDDELLKLLPPFEPPPHPGEFDPASVKVGNLKDQAKIAAKVAESQAAHEARVAAHEKNIETARKEWFESFRDKAALDATTGRLVAIGVCGEYSGEVVGCDGDRDEIDLLEWWWEKVEKELASFAQIIGFNSTSFDWPFLVRRSWILGVTVPTGVRQGRYWNPAFVDVMRVWGFENPQDRVKLDTVGKALGFGGKTEDVEGKDFHKLWESDQPKAVEYLTRDVELTALVATRLGLIELPDGFGVRNVDTPAESPFDTPVHIAPQTCEVNPDSFSTYP